ASRLITQIHASETELKCGDLGIQAIDKKNLNNMFGLNSQGWYISTDGGKTARTVATADGIVADAITTGTLRAITVDGVEIYGSYIEGGTINGATITSKTSDTVYTKIQGDHLSARGKYRREWRGKKSTNDTEIRLRDGLIALRNFTKKWSLYLNDYGISTFMNAEGTNDVDASGYIEFHSSDYRSEEHTSELQSRFDLVC